MIYDKAFTNYILNQKLIDRQFQHEISPLLSNNYFALLSGHFNGYTIIACGAKIYKKDILETMILDLGGVTFQKISKI